MKGCRPLTERELSLIKDAFSGKYRKRNLALFLLGCNTGFRVSELLSLERRDVCRNGRMLEKVNVWKRNMKGSRESRAVYVTKEARQALQDWLLEMNELGYLRVDCPVFISVGRQTAITRKHVWRLIKAAADKVAIDGKVGTHSMRKTFADRIYEYLDGNLFQVQQAMGHKDPKSTTSYLSFKEAAIDDAIKGAMEK